MPVVHLVCYDLLNTRAGSHYAQAYLGRDWGANVFAQRAILTAENLRPSPVFGRKRASFRTFGVALLPPRITFYAVISRWLGKDHNQTHGPDWFHNPSTRQAMGHTVPAWDENQDLSGT